MATDTAPPQAPPASRAGRDLPAAIGVGLFLGALVIVPLYTYRPVFGAVVAVAIAYAAFELTSVLARAAQRRVPLLPLVVGVAATYYAAWNRGSQDLAVGVLLTAVAVLGWRVVAAAASTDASIDASTDASTDASDPASAAPSTEPEAAGPHLIGDLTASVWVLAYVVLLGGFAILMAAPHDGARRVITFIATVVCSDVGGYAAGVLAGKHPLAPRISPKKSWEGLGGSLAACLLAGGLFAGLMLHTEIWKGLVFGVAMTATAIVGDLAESLVKRDLGVKDMGHLLPGHGGIMDRLDSMLISAPVAYLLLSVFVRG
jgi:phosphatidate cytidylyltransferase